MGGKDYYFPGWLNNCVEAKVFKSPKGKTKALTVFDRKDIAVLIPCTSCKPNMGMMLNGNF